MAAAARAGRRGAQPPGRASARLEAGSATSSHPQVLGRKEEGEAGEGGAEGEGGDQTAGRSPPERQARVQESPPLNQRRQERRRERRPEEQERAGSQQQEPPPAGFPVIHAWPSCRPRCS